MSSVDYNIHIKGRDSKSHQALVTLFYMLEKNDLKNLKDKYSEEYLSAVSYGIDSVEIVEMFEVLQLKIDASTSFDTDIFIGSICELNIEGIELHAFHSGVGEDFFYHGAKHFHSYEEVKWQWLPPPPLQISWEDQLIAFTDSAEVGIVSDLVKRSKKLGFRIADSLDEEFTALIFGKEPIPLDFKKNETEIILLGVDRYKSSLEDREEELKYERECLASIEEAEDVTESEIEISKNVKHKVLDWAGNILKFGRKK